MTNSPDFPVTLDALQLSYGGGICEPSNPQPCSDAFVARLNATGSNLTYATFLGGNDDDYGVDVALDELNRLYLTGGTLSSDFPTTPGAFDDSFESTLCGTPPNTYLCGDAFVVKLSIEALSLSKSAPVTATVGSPITYTLTVVNDTDITLTDLVITDTIPPGATYATGGTKVGDVVSWTLPSLAANGGVTQTTFVVTATQTITNSDYSVRADEGYSARGNALVVTTITDAPITGLNAVNDSPTVLGQTTILTATIATGSNVTYTWVFGDGATGSGAVVAHTYPALGTYTAIVTASNSVSILTTMTPVTITGRPELAIGKTAPTTAKVGSPITYTLTITNSGTATATNLVITDTIPTGATYVSGGAKVGDVVSWTVPSLAANGGVAQTTFVVTATQNITNSDYGVRAEGGHRVMGSVAVVTMVNGEVSGGQEVFLPVILKK